MKLRANEEPEEDLVQMAPLIDCVFMLLIFFLVTSFLQRTHRDLGIVLPHAASAKEAVAKHDTIIVEITAGRPPHGEPIIAVNGEEMTQTLMHRRLRLLGVKHPDCTVRVDADREVEIRHITRIMDQLQFEGFNRVGFRTRD
jgi:biopolymer transport protein ExbD